MQKNTMSITNSFKYLLLLLSVGFTLPTWADGDTWGAHLDVEAKAGNRRHLGEADLFLPLAQGARVLYFANVRTRVDDQGSREGNFGLGVRHMLENGWNIGAYGYFDRRRSSATNFYYNQATVGLEALGRDFDLRANAYVPVGTRGHKLGSTSMAAVAGSTVQITTLDYEERSLQGFDVEAGWRLPIFDSEAGRQLRVYFGGYRFSDAGIKVEGPRARVELAFDDLPWFGRGSALFLGAEAQHDSARGDQQFLSMRLRIPLGKVAQSRSTLSAQARRMTAPIVRDVDVVTQSHVASRQVETATTTANGQAFTLVTSDAAPTGAALGAAVSAAGNDSTVLLSGVFNTGNTLVSTQIGQTLTGTLSVRTASGHTATVNTGAAINGVNATSTIQLNAGGKLSGLSISNAYSGGGGRAVLVADGSTGVHITGNVISVTQSGANAATGITIGLNTTATISGNTISATGSGGATNMMAIASTNASTVTVSGNSLSASGGTANYLVWSGANTTITADSTGNIRGSGTCNGTSLSGSVVFTDATHCP
ncbi:hypothetical protein BJN45_14330 [Azonexus hydrophilus]|uniref:Inverse autotransporter beta-domain domain-containing protein n=2 Tax=Azonexus hydrophilus TaxID=418702 RepID=A0A1R1I1I6_9RHOO|nr:hypothetical protein BJN45_14330 [Azonexus hydrophilus]